MACSKHKALKEKAWLPTGPSESRREKMRGSDKQPCAQGASPLDRQLDSVPADEVCWKPMGAILQKALKDGYETVDGD